MQKICIYQVLWQFHYQISRNWIECRQINVSDFQARLASKLGKYRRDEINAELDRAIFSATRASAIRNL